MPKESVVYCGEDAAKKCFECTEKEVGEIDKINQDNKPMTMTDEDKESFAASRLGHICGGALGEDKVRDHDHLTGRYLGAAHNQCNLDFKLPKYVPIVFHNEWVRRPPFREGIRIRGREDYLHPQHRREVHQLLQEGGRPWDEVHRLHAIHAQLSRSPGQGIKFNATATQKCFGGRSELTLRKGVYPYDYMDVPAKLEETQLLPKGGFFSRLYGTHISDEEYEHAQQVFEKLSCRTKQDYHNL